MMMEKKKSLKSKFFFFDLFLPFFSFFFSLFGFVYLGF